MKKSLVVCLLGMFSSSGMADMTWTTEHGDLKVYGDVEFNLDAASSAGQLTSFKTDDNKDWRVGDSEKWDINGRILLGLDGYRKGKNDQFAGFSVQPLVNVSGNLSADDAAFFFGQEKNWKIKVGRFEAYDMFPLNQDTFIQYSGNTSNDLYSDGFGYIYMMKEGRGRSSGGGAVLLSKEAGPLYLELNTLVKDGTTLFADNGYHGNVLENEKNAAYVRPVAALRFDKASIALAMETNIVSNAYGFRDASGDIQDQSQRTGYGATFTWNSLKEDPTNGIVFNISTAYMNAKDEKDFSAGSNILWRNFELGYIFANNDIQAFNMNNLVAKDGVATVPGRYDIHTIHTSYRITNVMDMDNFNIDLGAYWSMLNLPDNDGSRANDDSDRYGARVRFKYYFF